ncbi:hypothetical protein [Nocardioides sp.]|uniref:hypothetical protein n=1 Tax=Nocardioides sp. TaxID=35761 RepID=UPI0035695D29
MGLRDLIEAKQRRTVTHPILVGNPSAAVAEIKQLSGDLVEHMRSLAAKRAAGKNPAKADTDREAKIKAALEAAQARRSEMTVDIELQSLPEDEWEAAIAELDEDAREKYDLSAILAVLTAASCTDPELQDAGWWAEQLARPTWTDGDKSSLSSTLLNLNVFAPRFEALGKG